ncbi:MAG: host specificity factor TipJ family phage tail protein, partial [Alphaproteobacteria bacterium]
GGGGAGGGSNPLQVLLRVALFAVAGPLAGVLTGATSGLLYSATVLGIQLAGAALINGVFPAAKSERALSQASPTYSLQAQGNAARIEQPIPVQYGRVLAYPDFAAQPYWEYHGEDQYLYQLLCLGCGDYDVEQIRIEDTPITSFEEITYEVVPSTGNVTLFPTSVTTSVEVSGQELPGRVSGTWTRSGTVITVTKTAHGFATGQAKLIGFTIGGGVNDIYAITSVTANTFTVTAPAVGTSGACDIYAVIGGINGFVASAAGDSARKIGIDWILPQGLYRRGSGGDLSALSVGYQVQARQVDDLGAPSGSWFNLDASSISAATVTPTRRSARYNLATPGRYAIRLWRTNAATSSTDEADQLLWGGLRAYMAEPKDRGPVTLIAMRMRASNNLSQQSSRRIGVIATRKVPVWNGTSWSAPVASQSIAWAIADAARNATYGPGLADARLDLAALLALDAVWAARGDTFSARFDQAGSWWDAVQKIAAAGRAQCFMQGGILRVVRDGPQTVPVALFSMRNIKAESFSIDYLMASEETADAVTGTYWDASTWAPQRVTGAVPGSSRVKPAKMPLFGIDNRSQALREVTYHAAANRYRRRIVKFATEMEGFIPAIGDLIGVQHDMPGWGAHAEAVGWTAATRTLTLSEPVTFAGASVIGLRRADGSLSGPWTVTAGATAYDVVLAAMPDFTPEVAGQTRERTHVVFGTANTWRTLAIVVRVQPRGLYEVEIEAVTEDPSVHTAETGVVAPPIQTSSLPRRPTKPVVKGLYARRIPGDAIRAVFGWRAAPGAEIYDLEMAEGSDVDNPTAGWVPVANTASTQRAVQLLFVNRTMIRVRGSGLAVGPWLAATLGSLIPYMWNTDDTAMWTNDTDPMWSP